MCHQLHRFSCGHVTKQRTKCRHTINRSLLHTILRLFRPSQRCDRLIKPLRYKERPCPACAVRSNDNSNSNRSLSRLPTTSARICCAALGQPDQRASWRANHRIRRSATSVTTLPPFARDLSAAVLVAGNSTTASKPPSTILPSRRSSTSSVIKSSPSRWALDYLIKARRRNSEDSDRSWVSPTARRIENGELAVAAPYQGNQSASSLWI
ncbi:hypothetical protein XA68_15046 [Ophiocordyceps unilateralis]|uniref:Uncharacterized protein n=1 Tax=Ophiocordyceps unilateralis TaxID=268505 RepID=A0A2A9P958_OPHUN|nr:hypothetical protein XA68_15046 [Ophiocordyceps unilateralis]